MTRRLTAVLLVALVVAVLLIDRRASAPLNPFAAPPLLALGSGQAATGAHCAALPGG